MTVAFGYAVIEARNAEQARQGEMLGQLLAAMFGKAVGG